MKHYENNYFDFKQSLTNIMYHQTINKMLHF